MNRNRKLIEFWTKYRVPFVYDDTLSLYQLVLKVIKHLNLMIKDQNELKDIIKEFIQAFDEDLQETVEEILVQWQGDGKLEEIINQALFESKLDKEEFEEFKGNLFGVDFTYTQTNYLNTSVTFVEIPKINKDGSKNILKRGLSNQDGVNPETSKEFICREKHFFVFNASVFGQNGLYGKQMQDGKIIVDSNTTNEVLAISKNGELKHFSGDVNLNNLKANGYNTALTSFYPLIKNGVEVHTIYKDSNNYKTRAQRTIIGEMKDKYLVVLSGGRETNNVGLKIDEVVELIIRLYGKKFNVLFNLDGGGSTQGNISGIDLIKDGDGGFKVKRPVYDFLYFESKDKKLYSNHLELISLINDKIANASVDISDLGDIQEVKNLNLNDINNTSINYAYTGVEGKPSNTTVGFVITLKYSHGALKQLFLPFDDENRENIFTRKKSGDMWSTWVKIGGDVIGDPPGNDFNNILNTGTFYGGNSTLNKPVGGYGFVEQNVYKWGMSQQTYTPLNDENIGSFYVRRGRKDNDTIEWLEWHKVGG